MVKLSQRKLLALTSGILAVVACSRIVVTFLESLAAVRLERTQDMELLKLCEQGVAKESAKMKRACLHARSDEAAPVVFKAILRACGTAFADFSESVSTPGKLLVVVLFAIVSWSMPLSSVLRAFVGKESTEEDDDYCGSRHVVVVPSFDSVPSTRMRRAISMVTNRKKGKRSLSDAAGPSLVEIGRGDDFEEVELLAPNDCKYKNKHA